VETEVETEQDPRRPAPDWSGRLGLLAFALLAYVPLFLTDPGKIDADSKAYLYLDPGRLLAGAASLWDPYIGMGTVAYQMVGFLFPVGPFYWVTEHLLGVAPWIAQRIWLGTLILAAGLGTRYLLRTFGMRGPGIAVGMVAYAFAPYALQFSSHQSVLLPPWAGMPWMIAFAVLALRRGGWQYPALLAITVQLTGAVNASTLAFALLAPALWIPFAVLVAREVDWRRAFSVIWRSTVLIALTSLWWAQALFVESAYGRDVLRFTEQPVTTTATLSPLEVLRGLGYWIFYYREGSGPVGGAAATLMRNPTVLLVSLLLPALALLAATFVRWSYRAYFVLLVLVGVVLAVGSSPVGGQSPLGALFESFSSGSTAGFALRNSARAVPLVALGIAGLLAAGVTSLQSWLDGRGWSRAGLVVVAVVLVLCVVDAPGVWGGGYYDPNLEWRSVPEYWQQAAGTLDLRSHDTRVLALPGSPFAAHSWGTTVDPVQPGIMTRPFATIEQIPWGSDATANLLAAVDLPLQAGALDPNSLAAVARLMGVGDVLLDLDLQTGRYGLVPADALWSLFSAQAPAGFAAPQTFGKTPDRTSVAGNVARPPLATAPPLAVLRVEDPIGIVRTKSDADPLVVDGDGDGIVSLASVGLLDPQRLVLYSPTFEREPGTLRDLAPGAALVVTDSNRKRPYWATSLTKSYGATEQATEEPLAKSPYDQRLDVFPDATTKSQTVTILRGVKSVRATSGYQVFNPTGTRPALVLDGNIYTGWTVNAGSRSVGKERLRIDFEKPMTTDELNIAQPVDDGSVGRWITRVRLTFDGGDHVERLLDTSSRTAVGQTLHFPKRTFSSVELRIDGTHHVKGKPFSAVGFQEIRVADDVAYATPVHMEEVTRMPVDLLEVLGSASDTHPLMFVMARDAMDDTAMSRQIWLPTERSFTVRGVVQPGARASDTELDRFLGIPDAEHGGVTAVANERYGDVIARASSAIDNDPATAWNSPLGRGDGSVRISVPDSITFDRLDLRIVDDGRHSVPTGLEIGSDSRGPQLVDLNALPHTRNSDGTVSIPVTFEPVQGRTFTFTISGYDPRIIKTPDHPEGIALPTAIAELGIPGVQRAPMPVHLPDRCTKNLLTVDGRELAVRVEGTTADALAGKPLAMHPCNSNQLTLPAGTHEIAAGESPNSPSGVDVEHLVLASAAGGEAARAASIAPSSGGPGPAVRVVDQSRTSMTLQVDPASEPYWLVLGQSLNRGWEANADGHDLGAPTLVDGFANGWLVRPTATGEPTTITLHWAPQRSLNIAFLVSIGAVLACIVLAVGGLACRRGRRRRSEANVAVAPPRLRRFLSPRRLEPRRGAVVGTVAAVTVLSALLVDPWVAPLVGAFVFAAIRSPRWRFALRVAPAILIGATAIAVTVYQVLRNYPAVFQWPSYFPAARLPIWLALLLVAADTIITVVWRTEVDDAVAPSAG
jgi:arabinofuranan 3-O-arabinosyltransferase